MSIKPMMSVVLAGVFIVLVLGCSSSSDDSSSSSSSSSCISFTANSSATNTITSLGAVSFGGGTPTWITTNFSGVTTTVASGNVTMTTDDLPPYMDYYWGSGDSNFSDAGEPANPNPNIISSQTIAMTFPVSPALAGSTTSSGLGVVGITIHGVAIFNNEANGTDILVDELATLDTLNMGHPTGGGVYHHHSEPLQISKTIPP